MRRGPVVFVFIAALVAFCIVQDRVTAAGASRYVALQRAARAGQRPGVTVEAVMQPAIRRSVRLGALAGGGVLAMGLAGVLLDARRRRG